MSTEKKNQPQTSTQAPAPKAPGRMKHAVTALVSLVALVALVLLGMVLGIFDGLEDALAMVPFNWDVIIKLLIMVAFVILLRSLLLWVFRQFQGRHSRVGTFANLGSSLVQYAAILVIFCWGLSILGVNISTIFASIGVVALILGFGAESLVADLITGIFMLFENQYNIGDIVELDGFRGRVYAIGIRTLSLVDAGGNIKIINNSDVKNIINRSDISSVAICDVSIPYDADLEQVEAKLWPILQDIHERHKDIYPDGISYLGVEALGDSAVVIRLKAGVSEENIFSGRRLLNREIKVAFDKAGLTIPYPQLDIHTK